ncbi:type II secretion system minor pseudopilin GspJ [Paraglaciecola aquimarina]|uniref:Type II secretion system protein J n=1 Tax=Paraglaciecola aquimarina TaxID=1235557 RepID=A0ABU3ST92_9ALTE|nr:type II secretion system minor pseudopilin GspJ [Paraglaciecola aquimarina]MDU0353228.1 type II secretion system minor pseudopilin GspJ [Paraglaciecola aquimarina]
MMIVRQAKAGFTLLEILVAMSIFTLIGLASAGVITSVIDSDKLSSERFEQLEILQRTMLTIERDLMQSVQRPTRVEGQLEKTAIVGGEGVLDSDADGISLVRGGWHNPQLILPRSTLQAVGYRMQENQLQRLYGNYVDNVIGYEPKVKVLLTDIEDFQVTFLTDRKNLDEPNQWQEEYSSETLPIAISITLVSKTFGEIHRDFIVASDS